VKYILVPVNDRGTTIATTRTLRGARMLWSVYRFVEGHDGVYIMKVYNDGRMFSVVDYETCAPVKKT
jgi:hypothetical protein